MAKKLTKEEIKKIPKKDLLKLINNVKQRVKKHDVVKEVFGKYGIDIDEIDLVPMCFADIDVSARTERGIIYFNYKLLEDGDFEKDDHYMVHELSHFAQQSYKPTKSSDDGDYLENSAEQEGFQNQTRYISDTRGDEKAEEYINKVLDHHKVEDPKERREKR